MLQRGATAVFQAATGGFRSRAASCASASKRPHKRSWIAGSGTRTVAFSQISHVSSSHPASEQQWAAGIDLESLAIEWKRNGFISLPALLNRDEVSAYADLYEKFVSGAIDATPHRHDLGSNEDPHVDGTENVGQIMWPSLYVPDLLDGPLHTRALSVAQALCGDDMIHDFDMLIFKAPHTATDVPWHSDEGYWPSMPDKRAVSFWVALTDVTVDMGCMWFVPGSHNQPLLKHRPAKDGSHVLVADNAPKERGVPVPLHAGGCTAHSGRTLHHTKGNSTSRPRPAFIVNCRPAAMVEWERTHGFDHGRGGVATFDDARDLSVGYQKS